MSLAEATFLNKQGTLTDDDFIGTQQYQKPNGEMEEGTVVKLKKPDTNIDHRRVPNLMVFFARKGISLSVSQRPEDYYPGNIVFWDLGGGTTHIGIVVNVKNTGSGRYKIVHNIGAGQVVEVCLFKFKITGHYRYESYSQ